MLQIKKKHYQKLYKVAFALSCSLIGQRLLPLPELGQAWCTVYSKLHIYANRARFQYTKFTSGESPQIELMKLLFHVLSVALPACPVKRSF